MAQLIEADNLAEAWVAASGFLLDCSDGKAANLNVAFPSDADGVDRVESELDAFLVDRSVVGKDKELLTATTVANTIFPEALYHPHLGEDAAARLYENYELSMRGHRRRKVDDKETYFNRLIAYPVGDESWNQLEYYVARIRKQRESLHRSSAYELGLSHPIDAGLRVQAPFKDKRMGSFPCLSHISLTLMEDRVHLSAIYRNQTFVTRAYGNYVGLVRLARFVANETGAQPGEVQVVATHADAEIGGFGRGAVRDLVERCASHVAPAPTGASDG